MGHGEQIKGHEMIHWYMVNKDGMAALCADQADAEQEAKNAQEAWPHMGPHRAVRLVEVGDAGFTAADMATAEARGFREGQAAELAAMRAEGEPVAWLSVDCIGERYLCFTRPDDDDPVRPLVFGDTAPQARRQI